MHGSLVPLALGALALSAHADRLLVLHKSAATLGIYDPATGACDLALPTGSGPHEVAVSADGRLAVVADYGQEVPGQTLTVLDIARGAPARTIDLGAQNGRPHGIEFLDAETRVVVTTEASRSIHVVDVAKGTIERTIETGAAYSHMLALSPDRARAFVANIGPGSLTAIDLASGERLAEVPTGAGAEAIAVRPGGAEVWVGNRAADTLTVVDARTLEVLATLPCASFPIRLEFTPDGARALVSCASSGDLAVFDAAERRELRRVSLGRTPEEQRDPQSGRLFEGAFGASPVPVGIEIEPGGQRAYVANTQIDCVSVIDLATWQVVGRIHTGPEPDGMAWTAGLPAPPQAAPPAKAAAPAAPGRDV